MMKRLFMAVLIVLMTVTVGWTKIATLEIGFQLDAEFEPFVNSYKLYTSSSETGAKAHVATLDVAATRDWIVTGLDLPPGQTTFFFLSAVYEDAFEDMSVAFPFKLTGRPVIISIQRQK